MKEIRERVVFGGVWWCRFGCGHCLKRGSMSNSTTSATQQPLVLWAVILAPIVGVLLFVAVICKSSIIVHYSTRPVWLL
jgi:hypothetical protein